MGRWRPFLLLARSSVPIGMSALSVTLPMRSTQVLLPFIEPGFECGDRAFNVVDSKPREELRRRLDSVGI